MSEKTNFNNDLISIFNGNRDFFTDLLTNIFTDNTNIPLTTPTFDLDTIENQGFVDHETYYELEVELPSEVDAKSINIDLEDNMYLKVNYAHKTENTSLSGSYTYTLKKDMDPDTLDANFNFGYLTITVQKKIEKPKTESKENKIKINRKAQSLD